MEINFRSLVITALLAFPAHGIVESVREVPLAEPVRFPGVFELAYKPTTADEVLVRLDDGQAIRVMHTGTRIFVAGQRVRVVPDLGGARIEPADDLRFLPPKYPSTY
jgi:hypothetical protein